MRHYLFIAIFCFPLSCFSQKQEPTIVKSWKVQVDSGKAKDYSFGLVPALGSGLTLDTSQPTQGFTLLAITDRGPNFEGPILDKTALEPKGELRVIPFPDFVPFITKISISKDLQKASVTSVKPLVDEQYHPLTGLPSAEVLSERERGTIYVDLKNLKTATPPYGIDPEGITTGDNNDLWVADEYGPALLRLEAKSGKVLQRLLPEVGLPKVYKHIQINRGFEGISRTREGNIYATLQSSLKNGDSKNEPCLIRILKLSPQKLQTESYAYPIEVEQSRANVRIGDISVINEHAFLAVEHRPNKNRIVETFLVLVDLSGATNLDESSCYADEAASCRLSSCYTSIKTASVKTLARLDELSWKHEKTEGLAILPDRKTVVLSNDNDFCSGLSWKPGITSVSPGEVKRKQPKLSLIKKGKTCTNELLFIQFDRPLL